MVAILIIKALWKPNAKEDQIWSKDKNLGSSRKTRKQSDNVPDRQLTVHM